MPRKRKEPIRSKYFHRSSLGSFDNDSSNLELEDINLIEDDDNNEKDERKENYKKDERKENYKKDEQKENHEKEESSSNNKSDDVKINGETPTELKEQNEYLSRRKNEDNGNPLVTSSTKKNIDYNADIQKKMGSPTPFVNNNVMTPYGNRNMIPTPIHKGSAPPPPPRPDQGAKSFLQSGIPAIAKGIGALAAVALVGGPLGFLIAAVLGLSGVKDWKNYTYYGGADWMLRNPTPTGNTPYGQQFNGNYFSMLHPQAIGIDINQDKNVRAATEYQLKVHNNVADELKQEIEKCQKNIKDLSTQKKELESARKNLNMKSILGVTDANLMRTEQVNREILKQEDRLRSLERRLGIENGHIALGKANLKYLDAREDYVNKFSKAAMNNNLNDLFAAKNDLDKAMNTFVKDRNDALFEINTKKMTEEYLAKDQNKEQNSKSDSNESKNSNKIDYDKLRKEHTRVSDNEGTSSDFTHVNNNSFAISAAKK